MRKWAEIQNRAPVSRVRSTKTTSGTGSPGAGCFERGRSPIRRSTSPLPFVPGRPASSFRSWVRCSRLLLSTSAIPHIACEVSQRPYFVAGPSPPASPVQRRHQRRGITGSAGTGRTASGFTIRGVTNTNNSFRDLLKAAALKEFAQNGNVPEPRDLGSRFRSLGCPQDPQWRSSAHP